MTDASSCEVCDRRTISARYRASMNQVACDRCYEQDGEIQQAWTEMEWRDAMRDLWGEPEELGED